MHRYRRRFLDHLSVDTGRRRLTIHLAEADRIEAVGNGVRLYLTDRTFVHESSLPLLLKELDPTKFIQVSPSTIVNLDRVEEFTVLPSGECTLTLRDGTTVGAGAIVRDQIALAYTSRRYHCSKRSWIQQSLSKCHRLP